MAASFGGYDSLLFPVPQGNAQGNVPLYRLGRAWALIASVIHNWGTHWGEAIVAAFAAMIHLPPSAKTRAES